MATIIEHVIRADGVFRRSIAESPINITPELIRNLTPEMIYNLPYVFFSKEYGTTGLSIAKDDWAATTQIGAITLNTRVTVLDDNTFVPQFRVTENPVHQLVWNTPADMNLYYVLRGVFIEGRYDCGESFLTAVPSGTRILYRLPLPNVYDNSRLCTGEYHRSHTTLMGAVYASLDQFRRSEWNTDLLNDWVDAQSRDLFQFEPAKEGFVQKERRKDFDWKIRCRKIADAYLEKRMVIA